MATSAPRSCACATMSLQSTMAPPAPGNWAMTPKNSPSGRPCREVGRDDFDAERLGASGQHGGGLPVNVAVNDQPVRRSAHRPVHQGHRLGGCGALVEHRGVGDLESGEVTDHGLEVQQRLEPALADLRLIRRVGGVPRRALKYVAAQHRWGERVEVALPDHRHRDGVGVGERPQFCQRLVLGGGRRELIQTGRHLIRVQRVEDACGQRLVGELVERTHTDGREHGRDGVGVRSDMARGEGEWFVRRSRTPAICSRRVKVQNRWVPLPLSSVPERFGDSQKREIRLSPWAGRPGLPLSRGIGALRGPGCLRG